MADNYLEKKMEEYRAGQGNARKVKSQRPVAGVKPGTINVEFPPRRVFVTGGASGIGRAVVEAFRKADCRVAFCDIDSRAGNRTAQATGARFYPVDVTDCSALENCMEHIIADWGDIDIIVNNVGIGDFKPITDATTDDFDRVLATNLRSVFVTARKLAVHRKALGCTAGYGRMINLCSTRYCMSEPGTEAYSASKGGVFALTHALMASLAEFGITVNSISPGWIENRDYDTLSVADHRQHPSGRVGKPEDIARMCLFLSAPDNDFVNGENIVIDGGMTRKMIYV